MKHFPRLLRPAAALYAGLFLASLAAFSAVPAASSAAAVRQEHGVSSQPVDADAGTRERRLIDAGWKFQKGDPAGNTTNLLYDVRPSIEAHRDDGPADAQARLVEKARETAQAVLKPWILPTGNAFIKDPSRRFTRPAGDPGSDVAYVQRDFDDSGWQTVNLPHDWAIEGPFIETGNVGGMGRLPSWGIGWYRKKLDIPADQAGQSIFLEVDGAMSYATVWLNGHLVGGWPYGYSSWRVDLTPYVNFGGDNQVAIRLDNPPASSRWYPGGGLYRHVWLTRTQPLHVDQWGTQVKTREVSAKSAVIDLAVTVANDSREGAPVTVESSIFVADTEGRKSGAAVATFAAVEQAIGPASNATLTASVTLENPRLWGPPPRQKPNRYVIETTVSRAGKRVDAYETCFGVRDVRFDPLNGVQVNGERVVLKGVNNHHDLGALGAAFNLRAAERQLEILREMGCNAVRMSHNPPAPELLELTDRMGFLVMDEAFDAWVRGKNPLDFHLIFPDWHEQDLRAMIRRDRNHPSIILWSVGNEVGEQYTGEEGAAIARQLCAIAHEEDPQRPATSAMNYAGPDMPLPVELDVISLNYQGEGIRDTPEFIGTDRIRKMPQYPAFHDKFPQKLILSSETASAFSSRGVYLFPVTEKNSAPVRDGQGGDSKTHQVSAYELHAVDFGSSADKVFKALESHPYVAGEFVWTGFDYLGEPTPYYTSRSSYCGIIDLAGFRKDRFYLYQSHWRPELPMAHILPHWSWPERVGKVTPVHVFTSGDEGELFLNAKSLGRRKKGANEYRLRWDDVIYQPGTLKVVTYKAGSEWATASVETAGAAAVVDLTADRKTIKADGQDLVFVTARVADANGLTVPEATNRVHFTVEGPGEIVATDNGDATSFEPFPSPERAAFSGLCLAIVRATPGQSGEIRITATSQGLGGGRVTVQLEGPTIRRE
jgi:beta-galactosidase